MDAVQQRRNFTHLFGRFDVDGDGAVGWDDYLDIVDGLARAWGLDADSEGRAGLEAAFRADWEAMAASADKDADGRVTPDEWNAYQTAAVATDEGFRVAVAQLSALVLAIVDADGDGRIDREDFARMARTWHLTESDIGESFAQLDADDDGVVSVAEIERAVEQFHRPSGPDDAGNWLWGPVA